jgi:hypothetical protein
MPRSKEGALLLLRSVAVIAALIGAAASVGLTLYVGRRNPSVTLVLVFAMWVVSPFVGAMFASAFAARWSEMRRAAVAGMTIVLTLGSVAIYARVAFGPPRPKVASVFLIVPLVSWLAVAAVGAGAFSFRRKGPAATPRLP